MTYKLLVLDLDGTLMGPDLVISDGVKQAIRRAQECGVIVTVATGRVFNSAIGFTRELGIDAPIICYQGAQVRDPVSGEILNETPLPSPFAVEAIDMLEREGLVPIAFRDGRTWTTGPSPELDLFLRYHPGGEEYVAFVDDLAHFAADSPPIKLLFTDRPETLAERIQALAAHFTDRLAVVRSHIHFGEITAPGVTKGSALGALAAHLGISSDEVMAVGDQENDLPMLVWAGFGIAMGNAPASVQAVADAVVPSLSEDGVVYAIETYLLNGK